MQQPFSFFAWAFRRVAQIATVAGCLCFAISTAHAEVWKDSKTGKIVRTVPIGAELDYDGIHAYDSLAKKEYFKDPDTCVWKDSKTGKVVRTVPIGAELDSDGIHAYYSRAKKEYFREPDSIEPCKPPGSAVVSPKKRPVRAALEYKVSLGLGGSSGNPTYDSTGGQPSFKGDASNTGAQFCGGATFYPGFVVGPARVGLDVNVCSGTSDTLFRIPRHGPGGDVDLHASTNVIIDVLFKGEVPVGPSENWFFSAGAGPTFRQIDLSLTSDQSFFGGGVPSTGDSMWQTGLAVSTGVSTFACPDCIGGNPLKFGVEGRARFFPSESVSLTSPAFGFTETGSTGRTTDYSIMFNLSVPIAVR